jgi:hypothetical protein
MTGGNGPPYRGRSTGPQASLQAAIEDAWVNAGNQHAQAGWYVVDEIKVQTTNPIHVYAVVISPTNAPSAP